MSLSKGNSIRLQCWFVLMIRFLGDSFHSHRLLHTASLTDDFKIFDVHEISFSGFSKDRLNPCTDSYLGLIFNIDKVLERIITAIKLYKTIPIRDRLCDSCFRIDEREADDCEGY